MAKKKRAAGFPSAIKNGSPKRKASGTGKATGRAPMSDGEMPMGFRGFRWQPGSEMEVVCLFGVLLSELELDGEPLPLVIDEVRTAFPDCLARRTDTKEEVRIEFELYSSHFKQHRHSGKGCDYIVCWEDDYGGDFGGPKVIELAPIVAKKRPALILNDQPKRPAQRWNEEKFREEAKSLSNRHQKIIDALLAFAKAEKLGPKWVSGPYAAFAVGDADQFFKFYANGYLAFPLYRWQRRHLFSELFDRLNAALPPCTTWSVKRFEGGREDKKGGWDAVEILPVQVHLNRFLDVWRWLRQQPMVG